MVPRVQYHKINRRSKISITIDPFFYEEIKDIASKSNVSISTVIHYMIDSANWSEVIDTVREVSERMVGNVQSKQDDG